MKDKTIAFIQKAAAVLLACLMVLCFLPVGLIPTHNDAAFEGAFIKIPLSHESYSDKKYKNGESAEIGGENWAYYKFKLNDFNEWDADEIHSVYLRLAFLKGSGEIENNVKISVAEARTPSVWEKSVAIVHPQTKGAYDCFVEVDVTEAVKKGLADGAEEVGLRVSGDMNIPLRIASGSFGDPSYRPTLKAAAGDAEYGGASGLVRAMLGDAVYVSANEPERSGAELADKRGALVTGNGAETYLRFDLDEDAIDGVVHRAVLSLNKLEGAGDTARILCINNDEWSGGSISYSMRPRGDENTALSALSAPTRESGRISFDVTQAVCEARAQGIKTLTFRITGEDEEIIFSGKTDKKREPRLYLETSDDDDIVCAAEAALHALGANGASFVARKLTSEYSSESGSASIRWEENGIDGEDLNNRHIAADGEITRPKWFEGDAEVVAVARIRSGGYVTERSFILKIPAETAPDYTNYKFGNYVDIGNADSENEQKTEFSGFSGAKHRWINGHMFTYRTAESGGVIALNLACAPDEQNYLTLKMWSGDNSGKGAFSAGLSNGEKLSLETPPSNTEEEAGFVYATYALPFEITSGRNYATLCLSYEGETESGGLYAAYITQSATFEPKQFAEQGERSGAEPLFGEGVRDFIDRLRAFKNGENSVGELNEVSTPSQNLTVSVDFSLEDIVFTGETNIAFSIDSAEGSASVYQRLDYYDRYSADCPVHKENGMLLIDYGDYKLVWNKSGEEKALPYSLLEMRGVYKELAGGVYCTFISGDEMLDDSALPEGAEAVDGREMIVASERIMLFKKLADPMIEPDWRVSRINGQSVTDISLADGDKIWNVAVKSVGGKSDGAKEVTVMLAVYEGEKIVTLARESVPVVDGADAYTIDFSEYDIYSKSGATLRVFVFDNTEKMTDISPKIEIP